MNNLTALDLFNIQKCIKYTIIGCLYLMDKNIELILREYETFILSAVAAALDQGISHIHKCKWSTRSLSVQQVPLMRRMMTLFQQTSLLLHFLTGYRADTHFHFIIVFFSSYYFSKRIC